MKTIIEGKLENLAAVEREREREYTFIQRRKCLLNYTKGML